MDQNFNEEKYKENIIEITLEEWNKINEAEDTLLIDIRDGVSYQHGYITGAVNIPREELLNNLDTLPDNKKIILYTQ